MKLIPRVRRRERPTNMTIVEHLEELRSRLVISIAAVCVGGIGGWFLYEPVLDLVRGPYCDVLQANPRLRPPTGCDLVITGAVEPVILKLKVVFFLGLAIGLPIVLFQFWRFVVPGLTGRERRLAIPFVTGSVVLFALGAVFAFATLPRGLGFLLGFGGPDLVILLTADRYIGFVMFLTLAFGLAFEFPLVLIFLAMAGVVSSRTLRGWRRYAALAVVVTAAVITPSQDPYTLFALAVPMYLFYEVAILVARVMRR